MSRHIDIIRPNGEVLSDSGTVQRDKHRCPTNLMTIYRRFAPVYEFSNRNKAAELQRVVWWRDTGEWVGIYGVRVYNDSDRWEETFVWAYRGRMCEIRQINTRYWHKKLVREEWH